MKPTPLLFAGIFASFAAAWLGLIVASETQIGGLQPNVNEEEGDVYPINVAGLTERGRQVYIANGCNTCHTQFVRDDYMTDDIARQWGPRRTDPLDYIYTDAAVIGINRVGPDLSNIGAEQAEDSPRRYLQDAQWHYRHLYNPRSIVEDSVMPSYRFLFETRKIVGQRSDYAVNLTGADAPRYGYEVVPTEDARALVAYLLSLDKSHPLKKPEAAAAAAPAN